MAGTFETGRIVFVKSTPLKVIFLWMWGYLLLLITGRYNHICYLIDNIPDVKLKMFVTPVLCRASP